jgi:hypothetical protein
MKFATSLLLIICMTSCVHVYYAPSTPNAPLFTGKEQTAISASYSSGGNVSSFRAGELQLAHSVSDHVGISMEGMAGGRTETAIDFNSSPGSHEESGNGSYVEFAAGYFGNISKDKKWVAELYAGTGFGTINNDYGAGDNSKVSHSKIFLQPCIGYKTPYFEVAMVPRLSFVGWKVKESNVHDSGNSYVNDHMDFIKSNPNFVSFEPAILLRGGGDVVKAQMGLSFTTSQKTTLVVQDNITETFNFSVGIVFNIKPSRKSGASPANSQ